MRRSPKRKDFSETERLELHVQLLGYGSAPIFEGELSLDQQQVAVVQLCRELEIDGTRIRWFQDDADGHGLPFHRRPAVARLVKLRTPGDVVLIASADQVLPRFQRSSLRKWVEEGCAVAVASVGSSGVPFLVWPGPEAGWYLTFLANVVAARRPVGELVRIGQAQRKGKGLRYCTAAPYGWRWRAARLEADQIDREQIDRVIRLRRDGLSCYAIAARFLWEGIRTSAGREWSPDRVRRVCGPVRTAGLSSLSHCDPNNLAGRS